MLRRTFLKGLGATIFVAPSIVRAENLMKVKEYMPAVPSWCPVGWLPCDGREIKRKYYPDLYAMYEKCRFPMQVHNCQGFTTITGYEPVDLSFPPKLGATKIISYQNLKHPNGRIVPAGMITDFYVGDLDAHLRIS